MTVCTTCGRLLVAAGQDDQRPSVDRTRSTRRAAFRDGEAYAAAAEHRTPYRRSSHFRFARDDFG